ncbi:MAG TPA: SprT-like domain-containing protein [Gemmataceae bacterium]|jgi:predicted SprT family Zn-dependent metalloprotease|nr:SprT-like domain-containing protein [Gemmataceae bacterium]
MDLKELEAIASQELAKHGLHGWTFGWADTKRRLGVCKHRTKRIEIAAYYALNNPAEAVLDTLLHEIAHALAGPGARHGPVWKAIAVRLGAMPRACDSSHETVVQPGDWQATCTSCKKITHLYRRPKSLSGYRCICPAHAPLIFAFMGDPALKPDVPMTAQGSANWHARCAGCETVHFLSRRPKAGAVYRCRCHHGCELSWQFRPQVISSSEQVAGDAPAS